DGNQAVIDFAEKLELTVTKTVESGYMTKDLALLVGDQQGWLSTEGFLDKLGERFADAMKN
ncbi:MAG: NADP-dependent isocitrate dehydrogenase, partial [Glycocaulis sp.]